MSGTGLDHDKAKAAVTIVTEELKKGFPSALQSEVDNVINGGKFGDTYREKVDEVKGKVEEAAKEFGAKAEKTIGEIREKLNDLFTHKKNPPQS